MEACDISKGSESYLTNIWWTQETQNAVYCPGLNEMERLIWKRDTFTIDKLWIDRQPELCSSWDSSTQVTLSITMKTDSPAQGRASLNLLKSRWTALCAAEVASGVRVQQQVCTYCSSITAGHIKFCLLQFNFYKDMTSFFFPLRPVCLTLILCTNL